MPKLLMAHTEVPAQKTAGQICDTLVDAGAREVSMQYDAGMPVAVRWVMRVDGRDLLFQLPARTEAVYNRLVEVRERKSSWISDRDKVVLRQRAERIGWRQLYRWVQAQMAMVDTGMTQASEVFLPYIYDPIRNQTLFEIIRADGMKALPAPCPSPDKLEAATP